MSKTYTWRIKKWTSSFEINSTLAIEFCDELKQEIYNVFDTIENSYSKFKKEHTHCTWLNKNLINLAAYKSDMTCMLKGLSISKIAEILNNHNLDSYIINFGGDIYIKNREVSVKIDSTRFYYNLPFGSYAIFTSGNIDIKRKNHIIGGIPGSQATLLIENPNIDSFAAIDAMCTKYIANELDIYNKIKDLYSISNEVILPFISGKLNTEDENCYCASPFFNPEQVQIRNNMIDNFVKVFRPDCTESSKKYDVGNDDAAAGVVQDNIDGIINSKYLVFPANTTDLGTLWEAGYALGNNKIVISYNESTDEYGIIYKPNIKKTYSKDENYIFNCNNKNECISMGYASVQLPKENIYYELGKSRDNLMLSVNYNHIEYEDKQWKRIKRNENERDL